MALPQDHLRKEQLATHLTKHLTTHLKNNSVRKQLIQTNEKELEFVLKKVILMKICIEE